MLSIGGAKARAIGWLAALLGCAMSLGVAGVVIHAASETFTLVTLDNAGTFYNVAATTQIRNWRREGAPPGGLTGVLFGDSVLAPHTSTYRFVTALESALPEAGLRVNMLDLTHAGYSAFQFYYLVNRVLKAPPDFAIVEVNLRTFARDWYEDPFQRFVPMATGLSTRQLWRVRQALATQHVGFLTPFVYRLDLRLGGISYWIEGVRRFGLGVLEDVGTWANSALGLRVRSAAELRRTSLLRHVTLTADHAKLWYGQSFVNSPTAQVLRAFSDQMRSAGVTILYVVAPLQLQRLRGFGISLDRLHAHIEQLREMVHASPEQWIDTTELFESSDFADGVHVRGALVARMAPLVVERLVPMMLDRQRTRAVPAADARPRRMSP